VIEGSRLEKLLRELPESYSHSEPIIVYDGFEKDLVTAIPLFFEKLFKKLLFG